MKESPLAFWVVGIAAITVVSGAVQLVAPGFVLRMVGADTNPAAAHFFRIVGMFMVLFGGMTLQTVGTGENSPTALLWAGLQKFGAAVAVSWGVSSEVFGSAALGVAGFDFISGLVMIRYRHVRGAAR
jgi:uncharacterized protein YjeT (DUF2065 family)